jgi:hypothetical protein
MRKRLSKKEFWETLAEAGGLYARCARLIQEKFGIGYTRQAVRERAEKDPEKLFQIVETGLDLAEEKLQQLFDSKNERVRLKALQFYLRTKGRARGYSERTEITGAEGEPLAYKSGYDFSNLSDDELTLIGSVLQKVNK